MQNLHREHDSQMMCKLALLSWIAAKTVMKCPHLVRITPIVLGTCHNLEGWFNKATTNKDTKWYSCVRTSSHRNQATTPL